MAVRATHSLIQVEEQRLLKQTPRVTTSVYQVVGVDYSDDVSELVHPRLGCEGCAVPASTDGRKSALVTVM